MRSPYDILGVPCSADAAAVRAAYLRLVREHPPEDDPEAFDEIAAAYLLLSNPDERARFDSNAALPDDVRSAFEAAAATPERAEALLAPHARRSDLPRDVRIEIIAILANAGALKAARAAADRLVRDVPDDPDAACTRGRVLLLADRTAEAKQVFAAILKSHPAHAGALEGAYAVAMRRMEFREAAQACRAAIEAAGGRTARAVELHLRLAALMATMRSAPEVEKALAEAEASTPADDRDARLRLLERLLQLGGELWIARRGEALRLVLASARRVRPADVDEGELPGLAILRDDDAIRAACDDPSVPEWIRIVAEVSRIDVHARDAQRRSDRATAVLRGDPVRAEAEWNEFAARHPRAAELLDAERTRIAGRSLPLARFLFAIILWVVAAVIVFLWFTPSTDRTITRKPQIPSSPAATRLKTLAPSRENVGLRIDRLRVYWRNEFGARDDSMRRDPTTDELAAWVADLRSTPPDTPLADGDVDPIRLTVDELYGYWERKDWPLRRPPGTEVAAADVIAWAEQLVATPSADANAPAGDRR